MSEYKSYIALKWLCLLTSWSVWTLKRLGWFLYQLEGCKAGTLFLFFSKLCLLCWNSGHRIKFLPWGYFHLWNFKHFCSHRQIVVAHMWVTLEGNGAMNDFLYLSVVIRSLADFLHALWGSCICQGSHLVIKKLENWQNFWKKLGKFG